MGKRACSNAAKRTAVACAGDGKKLQRKAPFVKVAHAEAMRYINIEEEEVVEEYRRAGKLHCYDPDNDKQMAADIEEYTFYLEENEYDFRMGLYSLIGPGDQY
ncbi:hypothetical protein VPH35_062308 [Triticum aestivum]